LLRENVYPESRQEAGFIPWEITMKSILLTAAMFSVLAFTPASAGMMACKADNVAKATAAMYLMVEGPAKYGVEKEIAATNAEWSQGNMRKACWHYFKAQKMMSM
jgi:hypothetical protein